MKKKDYDTFIKQVDEMLDKYNINENSIMHDMYSKIININDKNEITITIDRFNQDTNYLMIFTQVKEPDLVPDTIKLDPKFNNHNGKNNCCDNNLKFLLSWLFCYIEDLLKPSEFGFRRIPEGIY